MCLQIRKVSKKNETKTQKEKNCISKQSSVHIFNITLNLTPDICITGIYCFELKYHHKTVTN